MAIRLTGVALWLFDAATVVAARSACPVTLVSANDHEHSRNSRHYADAAIDLHGPCLDELAAGLRITGARVLWQVPGHYAHVHVEM